MDILKHATHLARMATAHNDGQTVLNSYMVRDWAVLEMSSWPRAQEALKEFNKYSNLEVYYTNGNKIGVRYGNS